MLNKLTGCLLILVNFFTAGPIQSMDDLPQDVKFKVLTKLIETASDREVSLDSQEYSYEQAKKIFNNFSETEDKDFFNYMINQRLVMDLTPQEYVPELNVLNKLIQTTSGCDAFKKLVKGYHQAYQMEDYSVDQLNLIEELLEAYSAEISIPQYILLDDAFSLCRQKIRMDTFSEQAPNLEDFNRIIRLMTAMEEYFPAQTTPYRLKVMAVAWVALDNKTELKNTLGRLLKKFPTEFSLEERNFWLTNKELTKFIEKMY